MKKIENPLKLPLFFVAVLLASCSDEAESPAKQPPLKAVNYTIDFATVAKAVYLGDVHQSGTGCFNIALTNADGDLLEVELVSLKAPRPSLAMPQTGTYMAATTHQTGTLTASASYWETPKAGKEVRSEQHSGAKKRYRIESGTVSLDQSADGTYTLTGNVTDGEITHLAFSWSGNLAFKNESGETDPVEYETLSMVYGDYYANDYGIAANTYMLSGGNERVELQSQLRSTAPADVSAPLPSDGAYTIDLRSEEGTYANGELTFRSGYTSSTGKASGTYWKTDDATYVATSGSFTVTTVGGEWQIRGILHDDNAGETLAFTYTGTPAFRN